MVLVRQQITFVIRMLMQMFSSRVPDDGGDDLHGDNSSLPSLERPDDATFIHPAVSSGDFARIVQLKEERTLTDQEKYHLLTNHFRPSATYRFPSVLYGKKKRAFQHDWLHQYNGLVYSETMQGSYCKYCVLFGQAAYSVYSFTGTLISKPLTNLQKASEKLRNHFIGVGGSSARKYHLQAVEKAENFKAVMEKKQLPVDQQLSSLRAQRIAKNREILRSVAETVILCGRQGLALRGHRDDWKWLEKTPYANHGNFMALLQFRIQSGDKVLADHLQSGGYQGNALYTSKTIQNELIDVCDHIIRTRILNEVRDAPFFSIMADEATDAANKEQLAISVRYVKEATRSIEERFLGFSECVTGVTGEAIADRILQHLVDWQLPADNLIGQTYDGAGAMAGRKKGAAARITQLYPKALYTHCNAHVLNLCVVKCCRIREMQNAMDTADRICRFFANSPKRQLALEKSIGAVLDGEHRKRIKSLCKTRWVERHQAFEVFADLLQPLIFCLEEIKDSVEWNRETRADAQSFFLALTRFPFIFTLILTKDVLAYTKALSVKLQGRYVDIVKAYQEIRFVTSTLHSARVNVTTIHSRVYQKALEVAGKVNVEESLPRTTGRQQHRGNVPASSASDYYRKQLTIPMLDHLINEMGYRFSESSSAVVSQITRLLPPSLAVSDNILSSADIPDLVKMYGDDLPAAAALDTELHSWTVKWSGSVQFAADKDTPSKVLNQIDKDFFPNVGQLLKIACTLSVTSAECERSISRLRFLKTCMRSGMGESRLNGLTLLHVHRDIPCDAEAVVEEFAKRNPRRLQLSEFC